MVVCAIYGCGAKKEKNRGLSFHTIQRPDNPEWQKQLERAIRRQDKLSKNAVVCSRHFKADCFHVYGSKRVLKPGSIPTECMPEISHPTQSLKPRTSKHLLLRNVDEQDDEPAPVPSPPGSPEASTKPVSYDELLICAKEMPGWHVAVLQDSFELFKYENQMVKCVIRITTNVTVQEIIMGQLLDSRTLLNDDDYDLGAAADHLAAITMCSGVMNYKLQLFTGMQFHREQSFDIANQDATSTIRSNRCGVKGPMCETCKALKRTLLQRLKRQETKRRPRVIALRTPLQKLSKDALVKALKQQRKSAKQKFKSSHNFEVDDVLSSDLEKIMVANQSKLTKEMKIFWREQKKNLARSTTSKRWHPYVVRIALMLHSQSATAYRSLRNTGVLQLPSEKTLRDYSHAVEPSQGFNPEIVQELKKKADTLAEHERWVTLIFDEMKIRQELVFSPRSGQLVGFAHQGDKLASHVLVFMVCGLVRRDLKFSLGYFGTTSTTAAELHPLVWKAVYMLEQQCGLKVLAVTSDKAGPNLRLAAMYDNGAARNIFAVGEPRYLYFVSDPPHLVKTLRNNLASSSSNGSHYFWNQGNHILWEHVRNVYREDCARELRMAPKLSIDHINLNSYSKMKVNLAVQVMSDTVSKLMLKGDDSTHETAKFIGYVNKWFDCLNVRSSTEGIRTRNPNVLPYSTLDDPRFGFFDEFLKYLEDWKSSIDAREGFQKAEKANMFLSPQTYTGILMTAKSVKAIIQFLLKEGVPEVFTNFLCQDPLEAHFGRHRGLGRRADNPSLFQFGYQENKLRVQRQVAYALAPKGNVSVDSEVSSACCSPLKKRKKIH